MFSHFNVRYTSRTWCVKNRKIIKSDRFVKFASVYTRVKSCALVHIDTKGGNTFFSFRLLSLFVRNKLISRNRSAINIGMDVSFTKFLEYWGRLFGLRICFEVRQTWVSYGYDISSVLFSNCISYRVLRFKENPQLIF
jgi:hypothetical protein